MIIGPTQIRKTISGPYRYLSNHYNVISVYNMAVDIIGPFIMSFNHASNIILFDHCDVSFSHNVTYITQIFVQGKFYTLSPVISK